MPTNSILSPEMCPDAQWHLQQLGFVPSPRLLHSIRSTRDQEEHEAFERDLALMLVELGCEQPAGPECDGEVEATSVSAAPKADEPHGAPIATGEASPAGGSATTGALSDWMEEAFAAAPTGPGSLPYDAYRANRRLHDTGLLMRQLGCTTQLSWIASSHPGTQVGTKSKFSIDVISSIEANSTNKKQWKNGTKFPARRIRTQWVETPELGALPEWKRLPAFDRRTPELKQLLFGLQVTSLSYPGVTPEFSDWWSETPGDDIWLMAIELHPDAASRFLRGEDGCAATGLRRGLLRSLERSVGDFAAAAVWTADDERPGYVTLFVALRTNDGRGVSDAMELDRGTRYVCALESAGIKHHNGVATAAGLSRFYGDDLHIPDFSGPDPLSDDDVSALVDDDADIADLREYVPGKGFTSWDDIRTLYERAAERWRRIVMTHQLPAGFNLQAVEQIRDYLLRTPEHAKSRADILARIKKRRATKADRGEFKRLACVDPALTCMRFFKGSPAQFAAAAVASGKVLGTYCDSSHKAGTAKGLYEALRTCLREV